MHWLVIMCIHIAQEYLKNVTPYQFWCLADNYPDVASRMHIQIRFMGNFGLNCSVSGFLCLICKQGTEDLTHFLIDCPFFKENVNSIWLNIMAKLMETNQLDGTQIFNFFNNQNRHSKVLLLLEDLSLPHNDSRANLSKDFYPKQSEKSKNFTRINYPSWRLRGQRVYETACSLLLFNY